MDTEDMQQDQLNLQAIFEELLENYDRKELTRKQYLAIMTQIISDLYTPKTSLFQEHITGVNNQHGTTR